MRKVIYNDQWFFDNGYFTKTTDYRSAIVYDIVTETEKFRKLFDTCMQRCKTSDADFIFHKIITPDLIKEVIEGGNTKRKYPSHYKKIERPEGYLTIVQRKALAEKRRIAAEKRIAKDANRKSK